MPSSTVSDFDVGSAWFVAANLAVAAEVPAFTPHALRRAFATGAAKKRLALEALQISVVATREQAT